MVDVAVVAGVGAILLPSDHVEDFDVTHVCASIQVLRVVREGAAGELGVGVVRLLARRSKSLYRSESVMMAESKLSGKPCLDI